MWRSVAIPRFRKRKRGGTRSCTVYKHQNQPTALGVIWRRVTRRRGNATSQSMPGQVNARTVTSMAIAAQTREVDSHRRMLLRARRLSTTATSATASFVHRSFCLSKTPQCPSLHQRTAQGASPDIPSSPPTSSRPVWPQAPPATTSFARLLASVQYSEPPVG